MLDICQPKRPAGEHLQRTKMRQLAIEFFLNNGNKQQTICLDGYRVFTYALSPHGHMELIDFDANIEEQALDREKREKQLRDERAAKAKQRSKRQSRAN